MTESRARKAYERHTKNTEPAQTANKLNFKYVCLLIFII